MPALSLKYPGDQKFQAQLESTGSKLNLSQLRAFLMGCILSEELVMPNHALEMVLNCGDDDEEPFKTDKEAMDFMSAFMGLWNEMTAFQFSKTPFRFSPVPESFESDEECRKVVGSRINEMCLFLDGMLQDGGEEGYEFDAEDLDSMPLPGLLDVLVQSLDEKLGEVGKKGRVKMERSILPSFVEAVDDRFEKALKRHLKERGKGPSKSPPKRAKPGLH